MLPTHFWPNEVIDLLVIKIQNPKLIYTSFSRFIFQVSALKQMLACTHSVVNTYSCMHLYLAIILFNQELHDIYRLIFKKRASTGSYHLKCERKAL